MQEPTCSKSSGTSSCEPVEQDTNRMCSESSNNNYHHHNRRHYRGGRRHQHHHQHYRGERERDRDRGNEYVLSSAGHNTNTPSSTGSKSVKAQMANNIHGR